MKPITSVAILVLLAVAGISVSASPAKKDSGLRLLENGVVPNGGVGGRAQSAPTLAQIVQAMLQAISNWFSDLINQILGVTAAELIKFINSTLVAIKTLILQVVSDLEALIPQVDAPTQAGLRNVIDNLLKPSLEIIEPVLEQLREILLYLPETLAAGADATDIVSDIVEALLGITLQEFMSGITAVVNTFNAALNNTVALLNQIIAQVSPELAAEIQENVLPALEKAQRDLLPVVSSLNQLPTY